MLWVLLLVVAAGGGAYWMHQQGWLRGPEEPGGAPPAAPSVFLPGVLGMWLNRPNRRCMAITEDYTAEQCRQECADDVECVAYNVHEFQPGDPENRQGKHCCHKGAGPGGLEPHPLGEHQVCYRKREHF